MNVLDGDYESYPPHTRIPDDEILAVYAELTVNGEYALLPYEEEWRERGPLIKEWGYQLRRRYDMDWTPSWEDTNLNPFFCEDSIDSSVPNVMDAVRMHDDLPVAIKATLGWTTEASIAFLFTDGGAVEEPRNHCVPILDTFIEGDIVYIVMPLLRPFNDPPFLAVAEVIDFIDQLVEGIEYMHQQGVAHRDITAGNIMMDASELYPEGFHPVRQNLSRNGMAEVVGVMRTHAPVRYYLIDFDSAIAFEKGTPSKYKYAEGRTGRDEEVPEFKLNEPYDPFKVDIYQFGNLLKREFLLKYTGVEFLEPLVREMTRPRPQERPNASALRVRFNTVRNRLSSTQMRTHLNLKDASDPFRERLAELGIDSLLESDLDDSPEHSSSEAPTTGNSNRSHDSYWSAVQSMESSITSQSSIEQPSTGGPLSMVTNLFSRSRSPSRLSSNTTPQETKGTNIPWKPSKPPVVREPSPPIRTAPQPISSSRDQTRDNSPERSRLKTGRFPWSPSSSPDSVGSPILAVVNQFLQPDTSHTSEDVFKNDYNRPGLFGARTTREQTPATFQQPAPPKASTPAVAPTKIRRNTVKTPPATATAPVPAPAPAPAPAKAAPEANRRGRDGWGAIDSPYEEAPASEYAFLGGRNTAAYGKQNKSSNALPMFSSSNNYGWDAQAANEQASLGYFDMPQYEGNEMDESSWMPEEAMKYLNQPPPSMPIAPRPTEKKEQTPEKKSKLSKSPFASLSKKSAPSEPVTSTGTTTGSTMRTGLASKALFAATSNNRKSTIAVEDGTPFNTPPKTTVNLPSPTTTSPVTAKPKKSKSKKGSISETPKEKDVIPVKDEELTMPPIQDDGSSKVKRRGSGASTTSRPTSPMAIFLGSRGTTAGSKKETTKPSAAKPSSFKSGPFSWGVKPKTSVPAESDWNTDNFSYGASAFTSTGWKNKADEATSMAIVRSPVTTPNEGAVSDYDMASEPVTTPPTKAGWKTKSYFPWDGKPSASSPKEEEEDLAHLMAQMTYPTNAEATPKAPVAFDFSEGSSAFQFTSSGYDKEGDDFWSGKLSKATKSTAAKVEPTKTVEEAPPMFAKSKTAKSKVEPAPEPTLAANKSKTKKGAAKTVSKTTIAVESPQPTPTTEAEEWSFNPTPASAPKTTKVEPPTTKPKSGWSFGSAAETKPTNSWSFGASAAPPKLQPAVSKAEPVKQKSSEAYDDWFGVGKDIDDEEQQEEEQPAPKADPSPQYDDWFSTSKPKATSKASKAAEVTSPVPSKPVKARKGSKAEAAPVPEPVVVKTPEDTTLNVEEETQEATDDWWSTPAPAKAAAKTKATKSAWGAPSKAKPAPEPVEEVKVPQVTSKEDEKVDMDDWGFTAATKSKVTKSAWGAPSKAKPTPEPVEEVKSKEDENVDMDDWGFTPAPKASTKAKPAKSAWGAAAKVKLTPEPVEEVTAPEVATPNEEEKEDVDDWWSAPTKGKKGKNAKASEPAKASPPAANKWESINFGNEEPTAANDDLAADLAATLGEEETSKAEDAPKPSEPEVTEKEKEADKPAAKGTTKGNAKKKKGKK